jgi:hypothetical protein
MFGIPYSNAMTYTVNGNNIIITFGGDQIIFRIVDETTIIGLSYWVANKKQKK